MVPGLIDIIGQLTHAVDEDGIACDRKQPATNGEFDIEFGRIALAKSRASNVEARLKPVWREMQQIEPITAKARMTRVRARQEIGRASGRERVCQYVETSGVAVDRKKKKED